jgi:hypothetical protein
MLSKKNIKKKREKVEKQLYANQEIINSQDGGISPSFCFLVLYFRCKEPKCW